MKANKKERSFSGYLVLAAKGFCMGAADVVPGVSGGTMAFILGIYEELIDAIKSFDLKSMKHLVTFNISSLLDRISWRFLLPLLTGVLTAVFTLARVLSWLLRNEPVLIWSFFLGLILASVVTVSRRIKIWRTATWASMVLGIIGTYWLVGLVPVSTPHDPYYLFFCGAVAICAMILPGISGSFILVLLGKYQYVLDAVNQRDFLSLILVASGAGVGIALFSRLLGWLLKRYHDLMVALLTGLMLGSLRKVWPWKETLDSTVDSHGAVIPLIQANIFPVKWDNEVAMAIGLMFVGLMSVLLLERMGGGKTGPAKSR